VYYVGHCTTSMADNHFGIVSSRRTNSLHNQFCIQNSTELRHSFDLLLTSLNESFGCSYICSISSFPNRGTTFIIFLSVGPSSECTWPYLDIIKTQGQNSFREVPDTQRNYISYLINCWLIQADRWVLLHVTLRVCSSIMANVQGNQKVFVPLMITVQKHAKIF
jgi:hypothetical protein